MEQTDATIHFNTRQGVAISEKNWDQPCPVLNVTTMSLKLSTSRDWQRQLLSLSAMHIAHSTPGLSGAELPRRISPQPPQPGQNTAQGNCTGGHAGARSVGAGALGSRRGERSLRGFSLGSHRRSRGVLGRSEDAMLWAGEPSEQAATMLRLGGGATWATAEDLRRGMGNARRPFSSERRFALRPPRSARSHEVTR